MSRESWTIWRDYRVETRKTVTDLSRQTVTDFLEIASHREIQQLMDPQMLSSFGSTSREGERTGPELTDTLSCLILTVLPSGEIRD